MSKENAQPDRASEAGGQTRDTTRRGQAVFAYAVAGATLGLALGFLEAEFLRHIPRFTGLTHPDVRGAIWLIAPLADAPLGALAGLLLGLIAALPRRARPLWQAAWAAVGIGLSAAYLGWLLFWFRIGVGVIVPKPRAGVPPPINFLITPALYFAIAFLASAPVFIWRGGKASLPGAHRKAWRLIGALDLAVAVVLSGALLFVAWRGPQLYSSPTGPAPVAGPHNNVVVIMLDTVRADHLSCYGYARPTTPHLDALARQGVLFEHAVAPTSWTLPALASVLTGLLPHQHGADWHAAMASEPLSLAEILKARGYETAAFNANQDFGLAGWGLDQGFEVYADAHGWLRHNLAVTFAGQSLYQMLFQEFVSFNEFDHLNAAQINRQIFAWLAHISDRPYFLFINYMDAHRPYVPPAPYDRRFGGIPKPVLWRISASLRDGHWSRPVSAAERQDLINGYDNSLDYLDAQIARLLERLRARPDAARTFVIVAGDHGEGFGEHGTYDHGWDLYREVLHVPLLVAGPGIPAGQRISDVAELREVFPTVIELARGKVTAPVERASLCRYWRAGKVPEAHAPVLAELIPDTPDRSPDAVLSLCDARWHYLVDARGHAQLFDWQADPAEQHNLAASPASQAIVGRLRSQMESTLARSVSPWWGTAYLAPLDQPGVPFARRALANPQAFPLLGWPVGSAQASFLAASPPATRPTPAQQELLRTLPYH
jgi:arylsulfatase A-like enzyme